MSDCATKNSSCDEITTSDSNDSVVVVEANDTSYVLSKKRRRISSPVREPLATRTVAVPFSDSEPFSDGDLCQHYDADDDDTDEIEEMLEIKEKVYIIRDDDGQIYNYLPGHMDIEEINSKIEQFVDEYVDELNDDHSLKTNGREWFSSIVEYIDGSVGFDIYYKDNSWVNRLLNYGLTKVVYKTIDVEKIEKY